MTRDQWQKEITLAVGLAWIGNGAKLAQLAQMLCDAETAREALIGAGLGADGDGLMDIVAVIVEGESDGLRISAG